MRYRGEPAHEFQDFSIDHVDPQRLVTRVLGIARQRLHVGDELAGRAVLEGVVVLESPAISRVGNGGWPAPSL
jgi:hypothetical protein